MRVGRWAAGAINPEAVLAGVEKGKLLLGAEPVLATPRCHTGLSSIGHRLGAAEARVWVVAIA